MKQQLTEVPVGAMAGLSRQWQELMASGAEFGTAAPRLRNLREVELRAGRIFTDQSYVRRLASVHDRLGADRASRDAVTALGEGAACVVTGQQPHLMTGPFYTAWKILGAIALARRLEELHGRRVVPVYWCGSDDTDFDEVAAAWLFDPLRGPWRLKIAPGEWRAGMSVGDLPVRSVSGLEEAALVGLQGPGLDWLRATARGVAGSDFGERAAAWALKLFAESGLVVVDARDDHLVSAARPTLEAYAARRGEVADAVRERAAEREAAGWPAALDPAARESGIFARRDGLRVKIDAAELDSGAALRWTWTPSVLLRAVVQDSLLAPVAAVLGPGEMAYHAEIAPVYELLGVTAARPVPRPHLALTGGDWGWPATPDAVGRLLGGGTPAADELTRLQLADSSREAFDDFAQDLDAALRGLESRLGHALADRARARIEREVQRLARGEADRSGIPVRRRAEWMARGHVPQERLYSCWLLWAWCADPAATVLDPLAEAWLEAVDRGGSVQWALALEAIR